MNVKESKVVAKSVKLALTNAAKHGGSATLTGYGMRSSAHDIAVELWFELIRPAANLRTAYPEQSDWMKECGFSSTLVAE
jgi:hypothetical protein